MSDKRNESTLPSYFHDVTTPTGWQATLYPDGSVDIACAEWADTVSLSDADVRYITAHIEYQRGLWWEAAAGEWGPYMSEWSDT